MQYVFGCGARARGFWLRRAALVALVLGVPAACGRMGYEEDALYRNESPASGPGAIDGGAQAGAVAAGRGAAGGAGGGGAPDQAGAPGAAGSGRPTQGTTGPRAPVRGSNAAPDAGAGMSFEPRDGGADAAVDGGVDPEALVPARAALGRGFQHTCFIRMGALYCWGSNHAGQLGLGDRRNRAQPERVGGASDWVAMCGGESHSCGLRASGALYCWGDNTHGELGTGDFDPALEPTAAAIYDDYRQVACFGAFTCALRRSGALYCFGSNLEGALGQNDARGAPNAADPLVVAEGSAFRALSAGQGHACAIRDDGVLLCWGRNSDGQLGLGDDAVPQVRVPMQVGSDRDWEAVAAGQGVTCGVRAGSALYCWGTDESGTLGLDVANDTRVTTPTRVGVGDDWQQISAARLHACGVTRGGALYCWGRGIEGQLGAGVVEAARIPTRVGTDSDWQEVGAGVFHSCGRRSGGVYCWGDNSQSELGLGDAERRSAPVEVTFP